MILTVILALILSMMSLVDTHLLPADWLTAILAGGYVLGAGLISGINTLLCLTPLRRLGKAGRAKIVRRYQVTGMVLRIWLVGGLACLLNIGYAGWLMDDVHLGRWPLAAMAGAMAPFVAAVALAWVADYPIYRALRVLAGAQAQDAGLPAPPVWSRREYLDYNFRHQVWFVLAPVCVIILVTDCLQLYGWPWLIERMPQQTAQIVLSAGQLAAIGLVFLLAPLLLIRIWRTARLGDGPVRQELGEMCSRLRLRYRDIRLWKSGGVLANAAVMGILPAVRYVLVSDGLIENMDRQSVRAVLGHEMGHILHHHLFYSGVFALTSAISAGAVGQTVLAWPALPQWAGYAATLAWLAGMWGVGFGYISRQFERQSDTVGAWLAGLPYDAQSDGRGSQINHEGAAIFAAALEQIARINGMSPHRFNWRHGSIASRISYIMYLGSTNCSLRPINARVVRIKLALWLGLIISALWLAWPSVAGYFNGS